MDENKILAEQPESEEVSSSGITVLSPTENENNSTTVIQADAEPVHEETSPSENSEYQALLDEVKALKKELSRHFQQSDTVTEGGVDEVERYLNSEDSITGRLLKSLKG